MKLYAMTFAAIASCAAFSSAALADECSIATLKGHYTYWAQGTDAAGKATAEVGQEHFDGAGNLSMTGSTSGNAAFIQDKGTYTVNGDCSGTSTYESGASYNFFIAPSGDNFVFTSTNEGIVQAGEDTRVDSE